MISFVEKENFSRRLKKKIISKEKELQKRELIEKDENIFGVLDKSGCDPLKKEVLSSINQEES